MHGFILDHIYYKHEDETQLLKMGGGSWTINLAEIANDDVVEIRFRTRAGVYSIDYNTAFMKGFIKNFRGEHKLVVPKKHWDFRIN
jgi:hypothetical protein|tara:strand:+ start:109 stop:366 length:258 start_codon:yes stop_codon:yes gene_type:complete